MLGSATWTNGISTDMAGDGTLAHVAEQLISAKEAEDIEDGDGSVISSGVPASILLGCDVSGG